MYAKALAWLVFVAVVPASASEPVGTASIHEEKWPNSGAHAREFYVKGVSGSKNVNWIVTPQDTPGLFVREFPGAHRVVVAGPPGTYTLDFWKTTRVIGKLTKPLAEYKSGDEFPVEDVIQRASVKFTLTGGGPRPDPTPPDPGPAPPDPQPPPGPVAPVKFVVVVVEETGDAAIARGQFFASGPLNDRMKERGHRWRVVDKDVVGPDGRPPADVLRFLTDAAKRGYPAVYLVNEKGKAAYAGPVPKSAAELLALITKWGG